MPPSHLALEAVVRHEGQTIARCLVRRGRYIIGHDRRNEIMATADSVSSKHARLTVSNDENFTIEDLGSANGTFVDGVPITEPTALTLDSVVSLGQATLVFERGGLPASVFLHLPEGYFRVSRYTVGRAVVEGSTSTIFEARDNLLHRNVAMKVLRTDSKANPALVLAFIREAQVTAQLAHFGILPVYDFGLDPDIGLFSATRFIEGGSLAGLLNDMESGDCSAPQATLHSLLLIFMKACSTIAFAHSRGVAHGALQPESIMFGRFGEVIVDRWGFAKLGNPPNGDKPPLTAPDMTITPSITRYFAPEQAENPESVDQRTDVYALGAILFRILTLRHFNTGNSEDELLLHALSPVEDPATALAAAPPPSHVPGGHWPERLAMACIRALNPSRDSRFANAQELKKEVKDWLEGVVTGKEHTKIWKQLSGFLGRH